MFFLLTINLIGNDSIYLQSEPSTMKKLLLLLLLINFIANAQSSVQRENGFLFVENKGQVADQDGTTRPDVWFTSHSGGAGLYFTANSIYYQFTHTKQEQAKNTKDKQQAKREPDEYTTHRFTFQLVGSNPHPIVIKDSAATYTENFYLAHCPQGILGVRTYHKVTYKNVYPGIDWVLYSKGQFFEYDFIVHPGADPDNIRFSIVGADGLSILADGRMKIETRLGTILNNAPVGYDLNGKIIKTSYKQLEGGDFGFQGSFPKGKEFRIDPEVEWFFLGVGGNESMSIAADAFGNVFEAGNTTSASGIAQNGFQNNLQGLQNAYVRKLDSNGNVLWATYYVGGCWYNAVDTDGQGNVYLAVSSTAAGLAYMGHQMQPGGNGDIILVKFGSLGNRMWATYCDGESITTNGMCVVAPDNSVYLVAGIQGADSTLSQNLQQVLGLRNGFISKYSPQGQKLWARAYGGEVVDSIDGLATDGNNNLVVGGYTYSTTNIDSENPNTPHQLYTDDQPWDGFYAKISPAGATIWSKYDHESGSSIAIDENDNIYKCGQSGWTSPVLSSHNYTVKKYAPDGSELPFVVGSSTLIADNDPQLAVANGALYIYTNGGFSSPEGLMPVGIPYTLQNYNILYLSAGMYKFTLLGEGIWCWPHFTGTKYFSVGTNGNIFATGSFNNLGAWQSCLINIHDAQCSTPFPEVHDQTLCPGATVAALSATGTMLKWYDNTGALLSTSTVLQPNDYYVSQTINGCESLKLRCMVSLYPVTPTPVAAPTQNICGQRKVGDLAITGTNIKWYSAATGGLTISPGAYLQSGTTYYASQTLNGCESERTAIAVTVTITPIILVQSFYSCTPATLADVPVTGTNVKFYSSQTGGSALPLSSPINNNIQYFASQTIEGCESIRMPCDLKSYNVQTPTAAPNQVLCQGKTLANLSTSPTTGKRYYNVATGGSALAETTPVFNGIVYVSQISPGPVYCESSRVAINVTVTPTPAAPTAPASQSFCYGATVADLQVQGTAVNWYTSGEFQYPGNILMPGTYVATQTLNGCESGYRQVQVSVTILPAPIVPSGTFTACPGATVASLTATGTALKWYNAEGTLLTSTDLLATGTYYVTQTLNGCESLQASRNVSITNVALPYAPPTQTFCNGAKVSNLSATGQSKKWYTTASGGTALALSTILQSGTYYVSQTPGSCESLRMPVNVTVNTVDPPTGQAIQVIQTTPDVQPTLASLQITGGPVSWFSSPYNAQMGMPLLPTTALVSGTTYYAQRMQDGCGSALFAVTVTIVVLGNDEFSTENFSYFPNPVTGSLTLKAPRVISRVTVYNMLGQEVLQITPEATETSLDFSGLADGVYVIDATSENRVMRFRVIKQ